MYCGLLIVVAYIFSDTVISYVSSRIEHNVMTTGTYKIKVIVWNRNRIKLNLYIMIKLNPWDASMKHYSSC